MVKMLTVLVSKLSYSQVLLLKKCESYSQFSAKILVYMPYFNYQNFNDTLTNDVISFEQLGPGFQKTN